MMSMPIPQTMNDLYERIHALAQVTYPHEQGTIGGLHQWYDICKEAGVDVPSKSEPGWGERVLGLTYYELLAVYGMCMRAWGEMIDQAYIDPSKYIHATPVKQPVTYPLPPRHQDNVEP